MTEILEAEKVFSLLVRVSSCHKSGSLITPDSLPEMTGQSDSAVQGLYGVPSAN